MELVEKCDVSKARPSRYLKQLRRPARFRLLRHDRRAATRLERRPPVVETTDPPRRSKDIRFHGLRHTAATLMFAAGVQPMVVTQRLGHTEVTTTMRLYGHLLPMLQRDVARTVEQFIARSQSATA